MFALLVPAALASAGVEEGMSYLGKGFVNALQVGGVDPASVPVLSLLGQGGKMFLGCAVVCVDLNCKLMLGVAVKPMSGARPMSGVGLCCRSSARAALNWKRP